MIVHMIDWILSHVPPWVFIAVVVHLAVLGTVAYLILLERKVASWAQDRIGPNRVGPLGLLQPIADGMKFFFKEDYRPKNADKYLYTLAPIIMMIVVIISIAVIPWGGVFQGSKEIDLTGAMGSQVVNPQNAAPLLTKHIPAYSKQVGEVEIIQDGSKTLGVIHYQYAFQIAKLDIGALFIIVTLSLAIYGVVLGGWASNNKYSFFGGLRAAAQMVSYEIPLGLSLLCVALLHGSLELDVIVEKQAHYWLGFIPAWNAFAMPVAFILFLICIHAEANRAPFDLAECEQELVGGYHTEYSSMRFALFFLAEYAGMITTSAFCVALFLGGWHFWGLEGKNPANPAITESWIIIALRCAVFFGKTVGVLFVFMWVRWSLPRFRFDQLMHLAWRALIPLSLGLLAVTALTLYVVGGNSEMYRQFQMLDGESAAAFLGVNIAYVLIAMGVAKILPAPASTNRRVVVANSRFNSISSQ